MCLIWLPHSCSLPSIFTFLQMCLNICWACCIFESHMGLCVLIKTQTPNRDVVPSDIIWTHHWWRFQTTLTTCSSMRLSFLQLYMVQWQKNETPSHGISSDDMSLRTITRSFFLLPLSCLIPPSLGQKTEGMQGARELFQKVDACLRPFMLPTPYKIASFDFLAMLTIFY